MVDNRLIILIIYVKEERKRISLYSSRIFLLTNSQRIDELDTGRGSSTPPLPHFLSFDIH